LKRSNRLVLLIGIFLAIVAFILIIVSMSGGTSGTGRASASPTTAQVVVATTDLALGATIQSSDVALKEIPLPAPVDSYPDTALVIGQVVRTAVTNGQLITGVILNSTGNIANLEVPPGFVAMSVQVDQVSGVGTIIKPGDFVDLISGFTGADKVPLVISEQAAPARPGGSPGPASYVRVTDDLYNHTTVKVLSQGLQVLGTLLPPPPAPAQGEAAPSPSAGTTTLNGQQQIVILAVPVQDSEVIKFSQLDGSISLVLRSAKDCTVKPEEGQTFCPVIKTTGITLRRLVDDFGVLPPPVVQVIQPTPYPVTRGGVPVVVPSPSPSGSPSASASASPTP
jgi:Flp pilus assembly protein CpaB